MYVVNFESLNDILFWTRPVHEAISVFYRTKFNYISVPCVKSLRPLIDPSTVCSTFDKGLKRISIDAAEKDCLKISKFTELKGDASELKGARILLQKIREILPRRLNGGGHKLPQTS